MSVWVTQRRCWSALSGAAAGVALVAGAGSFVSSCYGGSTCLCGPEHVGCEAATTAPLASVGEEQLPAGLEVGLAVYDTLGGSWAVDFACETEFVPVRAGVAVSVPPRDELAVIEGPPAIMAPGSIFVCNAAAIATGSLTFSGTGEALLDGLLLPLDVFLFAPGEGYENDAEVVACTAERELAASDPYQSYGVGLSLTESGFQLARVNFMEHFAAEGPNGTPTPRGRDCTLTNWIYLGP